MSDVYGYLWLIPVLPLLAAAIIGFLGPRYLKDKSHWPCVIAVGASAVLSLFVLIAVSADVSRPPEERQLATSHTYYTWFSVTSDADPGAVKVPFALRADALSAIMLVTVTFIGALIAIFSIGYMHGDEGYPRFFASVSLFIAAMTILVAGDNFLMLFLGWEGVGLCSYLLIGFWFAKPSAAAAARKAFLVNRIGDFGFLLGILLLWYHSGFALTFDLAFTELEKVGRESPGTITLICLLLFCGAVGKSAQIPLHVWLPDAMEGPTPVSALIHAATMVTAGVYMVARCTPLFVQSPEAQLVVACVGAATALLAALIALTQNDLKRVLAYSTLSQLGYMFLALGSGAGNKELTTFAVIAAIFHLFTHAFFKALLFLSAGSVMHAMGGVIDMRKFGGLRKLMPRTHLAFLCGSLALAGFPLLSGFWSKDEILAAAFDAGKVSEKYGSIYVGLFLIGLATAFLTAFYTFRAYFRTFWGEEKVPHEAGHHAHESPAVMTVPLMVLAFFAVLVGLIVGPTHLFSNLLEGTPYFPEAGEPVMHWDLMLLSTAVALGGIALAYTMYVKRPAMPGELAARAPGFYQLSLNKFHIDELYDAFLLKPLQGFAEFLRIIDQAVVDGLVDLVGEAPRLVGSVFRPVQNGLVQFYALAMMLGLTVFLIALARSL